MQACWHPSFRVTPPPTSPPRTLWIAACLLAIAPTSCAEEIDERGAFSLSPSAVSKGDLARLTRDGAFSTDEAHELLVEQAILARAAERKGLRRHWRVQLAEKRAAVRALLKALSRADSSSGATSTDELLGSTASAGHTGLDEAVIALRRKRLADLLRRLTHERGVVYENAALERSLTERPVHER